MGQTMIDAYPRPKITPERSRELDIIVDSCGILMPHTDLGECLVVFDRLQKRLRGWIEEERQATGEGGGGAGYEALGANVVLLNAVDRK